MDVGEPVPVDSSICGYGVESGRLPFACLPLPTWQIIEGVEFAYMGQQGNLGRYNIHFHVCGSQPRSVVRKNVMHDSKQVSEQREVQHTHQSDACL